MAKQNSATEFVGTGLEGFKLMMEQPQCSKRECVHWYDGEGFIDPTGGNNEGTIPVCTAFPGGIPEVIAWGDNLHTEPFEGDHGIQYMKLP